MSTNTSVKAVTPERRSCPSMRALQQRLKRLQQENLMLKIKVHMQEQPGLSTPPESAVKLKLQHDFMKMKADRDEAVRKLAEMQAEYEETSQYAHQKAELTLAHNSGDTTVPELKKEDNLDRSRNLNAMASALVKMGSYHLKLQSESTQMDREIEKLEDKKAALEVELKATQKKLDMTQQETHMKQRNLRKKKLKRSKPVNRNKANGNVQQGAK